MRFQIKLFLSVFCLVLLGFLIIPTIQSANAQTSWCCNNNEAMDDPGQCVPSPNGAQNCNGSSQTFFAEPPFNLVPVPGGDTTGDLCPNPAQLRIACMCEVDGEIVRCDSIPPPPDDPEGCCVIDEVEGECIDTNESTCDELNPDDFFEDTLCINVEACNPPPPVSCCVIAPGDCAVQTEEQCDIDGGTFIDDPIVDSCDDVPQCEPPPVDQEGCCFIEQGICFEATQDGCDAGGGTILGEIPDTCQSFPDQCNPPPPGMGCCIETQGLCTITTGEDCPVPPNDEYLGDGTNCVDEARCEIPPPGEGCCIESQGSCSITTDEGCPVPPNEDFLGEGVSCADEERCQPTFLQVPTMGEWGLIVMAGLLGIFSLIILRRQRYNVG